jgi:hypothetical protein
MSDQGNEKDLLYSGAVSGQQIDSASTGLADSQSGRAPYFKKLSIDLTFNTIKDVYKVGWQDDAPWFREISDGFCWIVYC